jgi:thiamine biosynthesis lipoprotein
VKPAPATSSFPALGTTAVVGVTDPGSLAIARALLEKHVDAIDLACSRFRDDSELSHVNARAGSATRVSRLLGRALRVALDAAASSGGCVDPTLGAELRAAGYDCTFALVRARGSWHVAARPSRRTSWEEVQLDDEQRLVYLPHGVELDLGATAKALTADDAARAIAAETGSGVLVCLGGDLAVSGEPPHGGWPVLIADDHAAPLAGSGPTVAVADGGLATSGVAVRRWRTDDGEAHHILDPRSGRPAATPWRTVSVAAASCVDANVAATAAVVLGEDAPAWLEERRLPARAVRRDGSIVVTGGWPEEVRAA